VHLDRRTLAAISFGSAAIAVLAALVAVLVWRRMRRLTAEVAGPRANPCAGAGFDPQAVRHVAVVRYDAFADLAGQLSFSVALLDGAGDGLVLSGLNGRSDCRTYAKGVQAGAGVQQLSPEEQQAVGAALASAASRR